MQQDIAVGDRVRAARLRLGLTQSDLCARIGMSPARLRQIELGTTNPKEADLSSLMRALGEQLLHTDQEGSVNVFEEWLEQLHSVQEACRQFEEKIKEEWLSCPTSSRHRKWLYVIQQGDQPLVKIGIADDVAQRRASLQTGNAERLNVLVQIPGNEIDERRLHKRFAQYRRTGEWFEMSADLIEWIESIGGRVQSDQYAADSKGQLRLFDGSI